MMNASENLAHASPAVGLPFALVPPVHPLVASEMVATRVHPMPFPSIWQYTDV